MTKFKYTFEGVDAEENPFTTSGTVEGVDMTEEKVREYLTQYEKQYTGKIVALEQIE